MPRKRPSYIWNYFDILNDDDDDKIARCKQCKKNYSFRSTTANLKTHLTIKHDFNLEENNETTNDNKKDESEAESEQETTPSTVWNYFDRESESDSKARCLICSQTIKNAFKRAKSHLSNAHPKLLQRREELEDVLQNNDTDNDSVDEQKDTYTEIIYLEDENHKPKKSPTKTTEKRKPKRRLTRYESKSSDSDVTPKVVKKPKKDVENKLKKSDEDEIDKFGTYITCLLKKLPLDTCRKLQMNIFNMVMNAKCELDKKNDYPISIQTVPGTNYIVINEKNEIIQDNVQISLNNGKIVPVTQLQRVGNITTNTDEQIQDNGIQVTLNNGKITLPTHNVTQLQRVSHITNTDEQQDNGIQVTLNNGKITLPTHNVTQSQRVGHITNTDEQQDNGIQVTLNNGQITLPVSQLQRVTGNVIHKADDGKGISMPTLELQKRNDQPVYVVAQVSQLRNNGTDNVIVTESSSIG